MPNISQNLLFQILEFSDYKSYSLERLMKEPNFKIELLSNDMCYISNDTMGKLWVKAVELSNKPILGYELHQIVDIREYGLLGRLVKYGPTLGDSFNALSKFMILVNNDTHFILNTVRDSTFAKLSFTDSTLKKYPVMTKQKSLLAIGLLLRGLNTLSGKEIKVPRITLPKTYGHIEGLLDYTSEIAYHDSRDIIIQMESKILGYKNIEGSQTHFDLLVQMATDLIKKKYSLEDKIAQFYLTEDLTKFPSIDDVANYLDTSPRTIQRTLKEKNLSFQEIQIDAKMKRALEYLKNQVSVKDTAHLVGYAESSSFSKAFKKYYGFSPVKVRKSKDD